MPFVPEVGSIAVHVAHAPAIAHAAIPIIPILLMPFFLVLFVVVCPIWLVATGVLSIVVLMMQALGAAVHVVRPGALDSPIAKVKRARRWVWTFGGLAERYSLME